MAKFCINCGSSVNESDKFCQNCGARIGTRTPGSTYSQPPVNNRKQHYQNQNTLQQPIKKTYYSHPEYSQSKQPYLQPQRQIRQSQYRPKYRPTSEKNKWIAFFLCFFLGELGIHRFYVGKIGTGILWLLTLGLLGVGWLVDLIVIVCGKFKDKYGLELKGNNYQ